MQTRLDRVDVALRRAAFSRRPEEGAFCEGEGGMSSLRVTQEIEDENEQD